MNEISRGTHSSEIAFKHVVPLTQMFGDNDQDTELLREMASRAKSYLSALPWCESVEEMLFGDGIGKVIAVFLARVVPRQKGIGAWQWVIVGDIPPAYIDMGLATNPVEAIKVYIRGASEWVELARNGRTSDEVMPIDVPPTPEWADELDSRLEMLKIYILPQFSTPRDGPR